MKKNLLLAFMVSVIVLPVHSQVTRLSNNTNYDWGFALTNTRIVLHAAISNTIWVYDIPGNSFTQLNTAVIVEGDYHFGFMNGRIYFAGRTVAEGIELWVTDGTPGGTMMLKDINTTGDSAPMYGFIEYNGEIYFTANDGSAGRELWKSNGTGPGTVRVKDINTGAPDGFTSAVPPEFKVINNILVFSAVTAADGDELWKTDGTDPGTSQLKNIYTTATIGSHISAFTEFGTNLIFTAYDEVNGDAIWKTDGTIPGTIMVKDINPNPPFPPPIFIPTISPAFFSFGGELFFSADDGTNGYELWKTNGTDPGTVLVKDIDAGFDSGFPQVGLAVKNTTKFFFSATTVNEGTELWESDGTGPGTVLMKDIATGAGVSSDVFIIPNFFGGGLFQGDKFFLTATTPGEGAEYYVSNGTAAGTVLLKDINPGPADGYNGVDFSFFYTNSTFFFVADNTTNGAELWRTDGTGPGTVMVADVNALPPTAGSDITFCTLASNTIFFFATDGDDPVNTDFFKIDGTFSLPLRWVSVEAKPRYDDILVLWSTATEEQTDYFIVQRSADGIQYEDIDRVTAHGGASNNYSFTDAGAMLKPGIKKWFYRVKYVDIDGKSAISKIVAVSLNKLFTRLRVMPNPVADELNLRIEAGKDHEAMIRVVNMEGKVVLQRKFDLYRGRNDLSAGVSGLSNGIYLVNVVTEGSMLTERFLIRR